MIAVTIIQGKIAMPAYKTPEPSNVHEKPIRIFNRACPLIIFANNRILKLKILAIYETNSIGTKINAISTGTPCGKNKLANSHFCSTIPIILIPIKCASAKKNVTTKELVIVKE